MSPLAQKLLKKAQSLGAPPSKKVTEKYTDYKVPVLMLLGKGWAPKDIITELISDSKRPIQTKSKEWWRFYKFIIRQQVALQKKA